MAEEVKDTYSVDYPTWMKKVMMDRKKGKTLLAYGLKESLLLKGHTSKNILQIQWNPYQNFNYSLYRFRKINLKIRIESWKIQNWQSNSEQKEQAGSITIPDYKTYYGTVIIKTSRFWHKIGTCINDTENRKEKLSHIHIPTDFWTQCSDYILESG